MSLRLRSIGLLFVGLLLTAALPAAALPKAKDKWIRVTTPHFTLFSNAGERQATQIGKNLERLRQVLARTTRGMEVNSPLPTKIYVFKNGESLEPYNLRRSGQSANVSGYFAKATDGNFVAVDASAGDETFRVIYHEYLHYFVSNNLPDIPLWLNEGLAEFYSTFTWSGNKAELGHPIDDHLQWLAFNPMIPLEELFAIDSQSDAYNEGRRQGTFYAQSWALTHYLMTGDDGKRLGQFLREVNQGTPAEVAFEEVFETDLMSLQKKLVVYVSGNRFTYFKFRFDEELADEEAAVEPLERAELLYQLGDLLAHQPSIPVEQAERHFREAIRLAPAHAQAHAAMGRLYATDGRFAAAATYFDRAIELDPKNARVHSLYGWSILGEVFDGGTRSGSETPQPMLDARELFRTAVRLDPSDSDAWAGLGKTFVFEKQDVAEGIQALNRAAQALPSRVDLLYDLMLLYIHSGQEQSALSLFDGLIRHRGDPELVRMAEDMLLNLELERSVELFNAGQVEQARKLLLDAAERANDPRMKRTLMAQLASLDGTHQSNQAIDRFNQAVDAANAGNTEEAIALLEQVIADTSDPNLKQSAAANIETLRAAQLHSRVVAEYNRAVAELKAGNTDGAIDILEDALKLDPDEELRDKILAALEDLKRSGS